MTILLVELRKVGQMTARWYRIDSSGRGFKLPDNVPAGEYLIVFMRSWTGYVALLNRPIVVLPNVPRRGGNMDFVDVYAVPEDETAGD